LGPSKKTLHPRGVPSWLGACLFPCQGALSLAVTDCCTFNHCNPFVGVASLTWQSEKQHCRQHKKNIVKVTVTHSVTVACSLQSSNNQGKNENKTMS